MPRRPCGGVNPHRRDIFLFRVVEVAGREEPHRDVVPDDEVQIMLRKIMNKGKEGELEGDRKRGGCLQTRTYLKQYQ